MSDGSDPAFTAAGEMCGGGVLCVNTAPYGGQDTNCSPEEPICVDVLGREPPFHVGGTSCVPCVNTQQGTSALLSDQGCPSDKPFCVGQDHSEPNLGSSGQKCAAVHPSEVQTTETLTEAPIGAPTQAPSDAPTQAPTTAPSTTSSEAPTDATTIPAPVFDYDEGIPCDLGLTFNPPDADYPQMVEIGDGLCYLRMTPDSGPFYSASAFTTHNFEPANTGRSFSMSLGYRIYGTENGSADGMTFVMHQDPRGVNALGGPGGWLGAYTGHGGQGIYPALIIEFDTCKSHWPTSGIDSKWIKSHSVSNLLPPQTQIQKIWTTARTTFI